MNPTETAKRILAKCALLDVSFAKPDIGMAMAWAELLGSVSLDDALAAVGQHYAKPTPARIAPGDIIDGVKRIRRDRLARLSSDTFEPVEANPDDVAGYLAAVKHRHRELTTGAEPPEPARLPRHPTDRLLEGHAKTNDKRLAELGVYVRPRA